MCVGILRCKVFLVSGVFGGRLRIECVPHACGGLLSVHAGLFGAGSSGCVEQPVALLPVGV